MVFIAGKQLLFVQNYYSAYLLIIVIAAFLIIIAYRFGLKKAVKSDIARNTVPDTPQQLNSLINSLNDIIFEFDEKKMCLNVWFNELTECAVDSQKCVGKKLEHILGTERAKKFNDSLNYVIKHRKPTSVEYLSNYGVDKWFIAKFTPVFNPDGTYASRISASVTDITEQKQYANALKENEILLLEAQKVAKIGDWWYDHTTKQSHWSKNLLNILEIEKAPDHMTKMEYYLSLVHPDDREHYRQFHLKLHTTDEKQFQHRLFTPKGNLKYIKVIKGDLVRDDKGNLKRVFGIIQDITDSILSEKAIKRGQSELVEAQAIAKIGNWSWTPSSHKLNWSEEIAHIYEADTKTTFKTGLIRFLFKHIHKHDRFILQHLFKSAVNIPNYTCVFRIITLTGKIKYVSVIIGRIIKNDDGSVRKIIGTLQDVTDRKQAEIDFKRTENKYKLVLENIKLVALSLDGSGKIIFCNYFLANLLGYNQKEILGMNWFDNFIPQDVKETITGLFGSNIPAQYTNPVLCRNGELRIINWQNTVTYDENGLIKETTSIGEDITDQQKATQELISAKELAERSSQFKSDFLSVMSHEIRTPMNAVIGTTNLLLSSDPKEDQLEYLNILKFSGENLLSIINDILDYNKIEAGKLTLNQLKFNIHHLAQHTRQSFYARAVEKKLDLQLIIDPTIPEFIIGDQMRLSQILNNLISNAIKFTNEGKVWIQLKTENADDKHITIKFTITDTGIGISAQNLESIFDPFVQEPLVNESNNRGTGLGLAITKRLVKLHKSSINVESQPGKGTTFTFSIPFILPVQNNSEDEKDDKKPMLNLHGMNVLIVDDNKMNLLIASRFLKKWQANVDEATNGQMAVDKVNEKNYDLIIMDLQMPVMNGFEATRIIKATHPQIPVIALTADAMPETFNKAESAGMCDYLTKPFIPAVLFEKVSKHYQPVI